MHLLDITLPTLAENLALDEALLLHAEAGGPETLRLWEWPSPAAVVGAAGRLADEIDEEACRADGVSIGRRSSGGGTVLLGRGCLLYSLILRLDRDPVLVDLRASYRFILGQIQRGLAPVVAGPALQGTSDLTVGDRKFSGNSQQRKQSHLLHHGTLLFDFDAAMLARYLKQPPRQPEYRGGRAHADFVANLTTDAAALKALMTEIWQAREPLPDWPAEMTAALARDKYETEAWIRRR
jgi:lipoate-protein ligase A